MPEGARQRSCGDHTTGRAAAGPNGNALTCRQGTQAAREVVGMCLAIQNQALIVWVKPPCEAGKWDLHDHATRASRGSGSERERRRGQPLTKGVVLRVQRRHAPFELCLIDAGGRTHAVIEHSEAATAHDCVSFSGASLE